MRAPPREGTSQPIVVGLLASFLLAIPLSMVQAQTIYTRRNADGTITFSNAPTDADFERHSSGAPGAPVAVKEKPIVKNPALIEAIQTQKDVKGVIDSVNRGADLTVRGPNQITALHAAVGRCDAALAETLLKQGAPANAQRAGGTTPLHEATQCTSAARIIDLLVEHGADPDGKDNQGRTALHTAAFWGYKDAVRALLAKRADVHAAGKDGDTPLHLAKDAATAGLLLDGGARTGARNRFAATPLHTATFFGRAEVVKVLLARGADPNATNRAGQTPMGMAAGSGEDEIVQALVERGVTK